MLTVVSWIWGTKYGIRDVRKLAYGLRRNLNQHYRFIVFSDREFKEFAAGAEIFPIPKTDRHLCAKNCFVRLRIFDPDFQKQHGLTDRIACVDLDAVITGKLDSVFDRDENFLILQGVNAVNPNPFNGSVSMLRAGSYPSVWADFSLEKAAEIPFHEFPDDQGWLWHKLPHASGWKAGPSSGIYGYRKPGWPPNDRCPPDARIIAFLGSKKPAMYQRLPWVAQHWRDAP